VISQELSEKEVGLFLDRQEKESFIKLRCRLPKIV
jgi:hypothetical protein